VAPTGRFAACHHFPAKAIAYTGAGESVASGGFLNGLLTLHTFSLCYPSRAGTRLIPDADERLIGDMR
jgi:hypothetical protein